MNQRVKELKKLGLSQGDVVLLRFGGRQTVAACEGGGREGGVLLSNSCRQSLAAEDGDEVQFISHFEQKRPKKFWWKPPASLCQPGLRWPRVWSCTST